MENIKDFIEVMKGSFRAEDREDEERFKQKLEKLSMETLENAEIGVLHDLTPARWAIYKYSKEKGYFEAVKRQKANMHLVEEMPLIIGIETLVERLKEKDYCIGTLDFKA